MKITSGERKFLRILGESLKSHRTKKGLTQEQIAECASLNHKYLGELERGEKNPTIVVLYRLVRAMGISLEAFISVIFYRLNCENQVGNDVNERGGQ